jgi:hypothetical protein
MRQSAWGDSTTRIGAGAVILLIGLAVWPWLAPDAAPERQVPADLSAKSPVIAALPSFTTFSAVKDRPLFSPSRRPAAHSSSVTPSPGFERYRLIGLLTSGEMRRALLADGDRRFEIAEGAALDGWTIARIEQDRVVLSSPAGKTVLKLPRNAGAAADPTSNGSRAR